MGWHSAYIPLGDPLFSLFYALLQLGVTAHQWPAVPYRWLAPPSFLAGSVPSLAGKWSAVASHGWQATDALPSMFLLCLLAKLMSSMTLTMYWVIGPQEPISATGLESRAADADKSPALRLQSMGLAGTISPHIGNFSFLRRLDLRNNSFHGNRLVGRIPNELTTLPLLRILFLRSNNLPGTLSPSFGNLSNLEGGWIPPTLLNISTLEWVLLSMNSLSGNLPPNTGLWLPNLEILDVQLNKLSGKIPLYLSNCSKLSELAQSFNHFTGPVPRIFGHLGILERFSLENNKLTLEQGSSSISFLIDMTNYSSLIYLVIVGNPLGGIIPESIGNLSSNLQYLMHLDAK
ncbi:hypothetical protein HYC85_029657 [Camellia sinensis]|uniref:Leucine-rich repeat-containing N-terminal plant-type domain-containing protein n=1 Tax=Camellia sinensis TaxID=4442 RepID=A0A7J7G2L0_CAMSI|nr:hypothetical protein HYC85_029657 [Camellia sinensis]